MVMHIPPFVGNNSKGHPSSLRGNWIYHRLRYIHGANVLYVKEFNTSQVCSNCHFDKKMIGYKNGIHHVNQHKASPGGIIMINHN